MKTKIDKTQMLLSEMKDFMMRRESEGGVKPRQRMHEKIFGNPLLCKLSKSMILRRV